MNKNYFAVGLDLIEHLKAKQAEWGVKTVDTVASISKINKQTTPALYIVNTSNNPNANGSHDSVDIQQWTVVISKVINHVQGHQLDDWHTPLQRTSTSGRPDYFSTFALYPFTFSTQFKP